MGKAKDLVFGMIDTAEILYYARAGYREGRRDERERLKAIPPDATGDMGDDTELSASRKKEEVR